MAVESRFTRDNTFMLIHWVQADTFTTQAYKYFTPLLTNKLYFVGVI